MGNIHVFNAVKGLVIDIYDLSPAPDERIKSLYLRESERTLHIRDSIVESKILLLVIPSVHCFGTQIGEGFKRLFRVYKPFGSAGDSV